MPRQVTLGPRLFDTQFKMYREWRSAFWRELVQNAVDGDGSLGSSVVHITIENKGDFARVSFEDNGPGMSKETLEKVYFVLGETGKADGAMTIGGYGMARILTCFAQRSYTIASRDWQVAGCGGEWDYIEGTFNQSGVKLVIDVNRPGWENLEDILKAYLSKCQLPCRVFLNGDRWTEWTYRRRLARELTFAQVHTNKSKHSELLVRVNGTLMFTRWTSASAQVIVEIDGERSRKVLQMSRDGLMGEYQNELDSFINEINIDKQSALRAKRCKSTHFEGTGTFTSRKKKTFVDQDQPAPVERFVGTEDNSVGTTFAAVNAHQSRRPQIDYQYVAAPMELFDVVIEDETDENSKVRAKIDTYDPRKWDLDENPTRSNSRGAYRKGSAMFRLLALWKAACEAAIEVVQNEMDGPAEIAWGVGWVFADKSDEPAARWLLKGGVNYLLLNPCNDDGTMKFSLSQKRDLLKIVASAVHEVAHIIWREHDERFANGVTQLFEHVMYYLADVINRMKSSKEMSLKQLAGTLV